MMPATPTLEMRIQVALGNFFLAVDCTTTHRVVGLTGPSGSGKTTWLETMAGLNRGAKGRITCNETVLLDTNLRVNLSPQKRNVGYVPQDQRLFPHLDVRENLVFAQDRNHNYKRDPQRADSLLQETVEILELAPLLERSTHELSGGERQRVALGRALCSAPRLLMLDEPLSSLDNALRQRILPFLQRIRDHIAIPIIIVSHEPQELETLCDEVIALRDGRVVATGSPQYILTLPELQGETVASEPAPAGRRSPSAAGINVLDAVHEFQLESTSVVRVGGPKGPELTALRLEEPAPGEAVELTISARDILLANRPLAGISARNLLRAVVAEMEEPDPEGDGILLLYAELLDAPDTDPLIVEITPDVIEDLSLRAGVELYLIIPTAAVQVA